LFKDKLSNSITITHILPSILFSFTDLKWHKNNFRCGKRSSEKVFDARILFRIQVRLKISEKNRPKSSQIFRSVLKYYCS
jgi:hypothetical protein